MLRSPVLWLGLRPTPLLAIHPASGQPIARPEGYDLTPSRVGITLSLLPQEMGLLTTYAYNAYNSEVRICLS